MNYLVSGDACCPTTPAGCAAGGHAGAQLQLSAVTAQRRHVSTVTLVIFPEYILVSVALLL